MRKIDWLLGFFEPETLAIIGTITVIAMALFLKK